MVSYLNARYVVVFALIIPHATITLSLLSSSWDTCYVPVRVSCANRSNSCPTQAMEQIQKKETPSSNQLGTQQSLTSPQPAALHFRGAAPLRTCVGLTRTVSNRYSARDLVRYLSLSRQHDERAAHPLCGTPMSAFPNKKTHSIMSILLSR